MTIAPSRQTPTLLFVLVAAGGAAALSWEVLWQLKAALAVGVSALGTALTLAATMTGMTAGSLFMGRWLRLREPQNPLRLYGLLELAIGISGLLLAPAFRLLESLDASIYRSTPEAAPLLHLAGIALILGLPTFAMGATVPLFGLVARRYQTSIALLYGLNTLGAGIGVLLMAFVVMPALGVWQSTLLIATVNALVAAATFTLRANEASTAIPELPATAAERLPYSRVALVVFVTGFATFGLEVAWFRALRSAYLSMSYSFAILLAAVLIPLALAARKVPELKQKGSRLGLLVAGAAVAILLATPVIERFDELSRYYVFLPLPSWFVQSILVIGPAMLLLGMALPWLLDEQQSPRDWSRLYAINTLGAILGALTAGWVLLPAFGFARSAWLLAGLVLASSLILSTRRDQLIALAGGSVALIVAFVAESGVGRERVIGAGPASEYELVAFRETPDSTVSVLDMSGRRILFIDGFSAADETSAADYMSWMGRLPMLQHPNPKQALVICFGTGQTANAVREEGPEHLTIVDLSKAVFDLAPKFPTNHGVLDDPRVSHVTMDGRAWLRRTNETYDIVTLEPLPPTFAGMNALYSREFYQLVSARLNPGGIVAQWMPFHLLDAKQAAAIAATFCEAYSGAILWLDPLDHTGILLGRKGDGLALEKNWPGLVRPSSSRTLTPEAVAAAAVLDAAALKRFAKLGVVITDDNQRLAYSFTLHPGLTNPQELAGINLARVEGARKGDIPPP